MLPWKSKRRPISLLVWAAVLSCASGCSHAGFQKVGDGVYVSQSSPGLEQAAEKISAARKESTVSSTQPAELTVEVNPDSGIGSEEFRILVEQNWIRVEGGGTAGAFYGALALEKGIRASRDPSRLQVSRVSPICGRRILRTKLELPGLSDRPDRVEWKSLLDEVAFARFNILMARCGHVFPSIVTLQQFPKAFDPKLKGASSRRAQEFKAFLKDLEERHIRLILVPTDLQGPASFYRSYGGGTPQPSVGSPLSKAYIKACLAEILKAYPQVEGVGVCLEALQDVPLAERESFVRSVYLDGLRASGRSATLFLDAGIEEKLASVRAEGDVEVVREVLLSPSRLCGEWNPAPQETPGSELCGRIPWRILTPTLPVPGQLRPLLEKATKLAPAGFVLDFLDDPAGAGANRYLSDRERFFLTAYGTASFRCPWEDEFTAFPWRCFDPQETRKVSEIAGAVARSWDDLARIHSSQRGWSPLTATEAPDGQGRPGEPRDDAPFVSVLEFAFSPRGDPRVLTIPETVAAEIKGEPVAESRITPQAAAKDMLDGCQAALAGIRELGFEGVSSGEKTDAQDARRLLLGELAGTAHLAMFHSRRIASAGHLVRYAAGLGAHYKDLARQEAESGRASWGAAQQLFSELRASCENSDRFPDLRPWESQVARDVKLVEETLSDPAGFRFSALVKRWPSAGECDFASLAGVIHLGTDIFNYPPQELAGDSQVFEAEDFYGTWKTLAEFPGYSGTGYISSGTSGRPAELPVTLRLTIPGPARYHFWVRGLQGGGQDLPSVRLRVSELDLEPTQETGQGPRQFNWEKAGFADLAAGDAFLQIVDHGQGAEGVDAVVITRDGSWAPPSL